MFNLIEDQNYDKLNQINIDESISNAIKVSK